MKKKIVKAASLAVLGGFAVASLASCGAKQKPWVEPVLPEYKATVTDGGKVVNIRCWNDEFINLFAKYYNKDLTVVKAKEEYKLGDITYKFNVVANQGNAYQDALDAVLENNLTASANDKVDLFLMEADYALKYVNSNYTLDVKDIGITDADTAEMYQYTKDVATASDGRLKGLSWQATPGLFAYRTDIAEAVLGTSDPTEVQAKISDWTKFDAVAAQMKAKNYTMLSGFDDSYRVFSNNIKQPLVNVKTGEIQIDDQLNKWIDQTKKYTDAGYNKKTTLWSTEWSNEQTINGSTFGFFYSTWGINFTLKGNAEVENSAKENLIGKYRVVEGPASYFWGGTWLAPANGTDNKTEVANILKVMTCDGTVADKITRDTQDYTNNKAAMNAIATDKTYGSEFLGGQNHVALFAKSAPKIEMKNLSSWDQGINEKLQEAMKDYFLGQVKIDKAWSNFYKKVKQVYPELRKKAD